MICDAGGPHMPDVRAELHSVSCLTIWIDTGRVCCTATAIGLQSTSPGFFRSGSGDLVVTIMISTLNEFSLYIPEGPCTHIVYTLAPMYLNRDYFKANVYTI